MEGIFLKVALQNSKMETLSWLKTETVIIGGLRRRKGGRPLPLAQFLFVIMQFGGKIGQIIDLRKPPPCLAKAGSVNVDTSRIFADFTFNGEPIGSPLYGQHDCVFVCVCVAATVGDDSKIQT